MSLKRSSNVSNLKVIHGLKFQKRKNKVFSD